MTKVKLFLALIITILTTQLCLAQNNQTFTVNGVTFEMIYVKGGTFTMGCTSEQDGSCYDDEKPAHKVTLSSFYIGKYEVTQAQWKAVVGYNPSISKDDKLPVSSVDYGNVDDFIERLNRATGKNFCLPTEAQWEFAARGGTKSNGYKYSGSNNVDDVGWSYSITGFGRIYNVGRKLPNELGIYDMSGNVWELCSDTYSADYYANSPSANPTGPSPYKRHDVLRGGSSIDIARCCRVSHRRENKSTSDDYNGFRLALYIPHKQGTAKNGVTPYYYNDDNGVFNVYFVNNNESEFVVEWKLLYTYNTPQANPKIDASKIIKTIVKGNTTSSTVEVAALAEIFDYGHVTVEILSAELTAEAKKAKEELARQTQLKTLYDQAFKEYDNKLYDLAKENLQKILVLDPTYWQANNLMGNIYYTNKNYTNAISYYQKAIANNPNGAFIHRNLANTYLDTKNYTEAVKSYQKAIAVSNSESDNRTCYEKMIMPYLYLGNLEESVNCAKKAANDNILTYMNNKTNALEVGDYTSAINNQLLLLGKKEFGSDYYELSWYLLLTKQYETAEKAARKAVPLCEASEDIATLENLSLYAKKNLAYSLLLQGKITEAKEILSDNAGKRLNDGRSFILTALEDLNELEKAGVIPAAQKANVETIKKLLNEKTNERKAFVEIEMIYVEGGTFTMGCTKEQGNDCLDSEKPVHQVTVSSFYIGKYEVTQAQWKAVMGNNPSEFEGDNFPVESVSWYDIQEFILILNAGTGKTYRLPTEAEWEFAARGGNKSQGYKYSGSNTIDNVAWYFNEDNYNEYNATTYPVGTKSPNELGIYDMSGNVYEWCNDWRGDYSSNAQVNPKGPSSGHYRVVRGGSYNFNENPCRVSFRFSDPPKYGYINHGFRLVLEQ